MYFITDSSYFLYFGIFWKCNYMIIIFSRLIFSNVDNDYLALSTKHIYLAVPVSVSLERRMWGQLWMARTKLWNRLIPHRLRNFWDQTHSPCRQVLYTRADGDSCNSFCRRIFWWNIMILFKNLSRNISQSGHLAPAWRYMQNVVPCALILQPNICWIWTSAARGLRS